MVQASEVVNEASKANTKHFKHGPWPFTTVLTDSTYDVNDTVYDQIRMEWLKPERQDNFALVLWEYRVES
jgi:hypothetical protein